MKRSDILRAEAELQRHMLRAQLQSLRNDPKPLITELLGTGIGAAALRRVLPRVMPALLHGRGAGRGQWALYGWLALKAFRVAFPRRR